MFRRKKVRVYLKSGAVVKFRCRDWQMTTGDDTGSVRKYNFTWRWWHNTRPVGITVGDIAAVTVSRW